MYIYILTPKTECANKMRKLKTNISYFSITFSNGGPNTNWPVLEKFIAAREVNDEPKLAEIGSCGLHIVSGSLNAGVNVNDWKVNEVMNAIWKILSDSPARRDLDLKCNISGKLPQRYFGTRWAENEDTAESRS